MAAPPIQTKILGFKEPRGKSRVFHSDCKGMLAGSLN